MLRRAKEGQLALVRQEFARTAGMASSEAARPSVPAAFPLPAPPVAKPLASSTGNFDSRSGDASVPTVVPASAGANGSSKSGIVGGGARLKGAWSEVVRGPAASLDNGLAALVNEPSASSSFALSAACTSTSNHSSSKHPTKSGIPAMSPVSEQPATSTPTPPPLASSPTSRSAVVKKADDLKDRYQSESAGGEDCSQDEVEAPCKAATGVAADNPAKPSKPAWRKTLINSSMMTVVGPLMGSDLWPALADARSSKAPSDVLTNYFPPAGPGLLEESLDQVWFTSMLL